MRLTILHSIAMGTVMTVGMAVILAVTPTDGPFEVTRSTIDGGGVMRSAGGDFELSGTIGQSDTGTMGGGEFELTSGFWFGLTPTDCNEDGFVSLPDYAIIVDCLMGPNLGITVNPCTCFDVDHDGDITLGDFAVLQTNFTGN